MLAKMLDEKIFREERSEQWPSIHKLTRRVQFGRKRTYTYFPFIFGQ